MNLKKIFTLLAAAAAIAAAAVVCVVAAACALHAFALQYLTPAGAAGVVALAFALVAAAIAFALTMKANPHRSKLTSPAEPPLTDRLIQLARDRPIVAGAAAIAAAVFVARNPKIMNVVLSAALATKAARTPSKPSRKKP